MKIYTWVYRQGVLISSGNTIEEAKQKLINSHQGFGIIRALEHDPINIEKIEEFSYVDEGQW